MIDLYLPPKPAVIRPVDKEIIRPGDPRFGMPVLAIGFGLTALTGFAAGGEPARAAITGMKTWGSSNGGYSNNQSRTIDLVLKASNTDPTTNSWAGTTIGTIAQFSNTWATNAKQTLGNANSTRYRYVWLDQTITADDIPFLCEVEFYETLGGVETAINPSGKTIINSGYGTRTSVAFDGNTNQLANDSASGSVASVMRIGLDLGV